MRLREPPQQVNDRNFEKLESYYHGGHEIPFEGQRHRVKPREKPFKICFAHQLAVLVFPESAFLCASVPLW
jgi:hypothetical protein